MWLLEQLRSGDVNAAYFAFALQTIGIAVVSVLLAKNKGMNFKLALILGLFPFVNYFSLIFYIGASEKR